MYSSLIDTMSNGNISDFKYQITEMSADEIALWSYWLFFTAQGQYSETIVTRAFLLTKLSFEKQKPNQRRVYVR